MHLSEFQQHIRDRYFASDNARGAAGTFLWFSEEVGELAHALANAARGKPDAANLREEFAAYGLPFWFMCISGVDLEQAVREKYMGNDGGPKGEK